MKINFPKTFLNLGEIDLHLFEGETTRQNRVSGFSDFVKIAILIFSNIFNRDFLGSL